MLNMPNNSIKVTFGLMVAFGLSCIALGQERGPSSKEVRNTAPRHEEAVRDSHDMKSVAYGRSQVRDIPIDLLVAIDHGSIPKRVNGAMYGWIESVFNAKASPLVKGNPLDPGKMAIRVFAATLPAENDLVEYRWIHDGLDIRLLASIDVLQIELDLDQAQKQAGLQMTLADYVRDYLINMLQLHGEDQYKDHYQIDLPWPKDLQDGLEFSSNPGQDLNFLTRWHQRVDAFVDGHRFCVLIYKKPDQLMNFRDGSKWFPSDFRLLVQEKAREQAKLPSKVPKSDE